MDVLRAIVMAFACFSTIPMPRVDWDAPAKRYLLVAFPAVGLVVGAVVALWCLLCVQVGFGPAVRAVGIVLAPLVVTGGIHLDGFADVADALSSHAEPERKRQIMADPHIGAFAAMAVAALLIAGFAFAQELPLPRGLVTLCLIPVASRALSGLASVLFAGSSEEGMLAGFRISAAPRAVPVALVIWLVAAVVGMVAADGPLTLVPIAGMLVCFAVLRPFARRQFGGMSGDVAGWFLCVCELVALVCLVCVGKAW